MMRALILNDVTVIMSHPTPPGEKSNRVDEVRAVVDEDYERIARTNDPYLVLNLDADANIAEVRRRYERYEKFYRVDNFRRFSDPKLTRRALDIRRAIGRAMVSINSNQKFRSMEFARSADAAGEGSSTVNPDYAALGDIYFRDGLTYLKLRDLNSAEDCLQRAVNYDPTRGILLAYFSYAQFKLRNNDPRVVEESGKQLLRAAEMSPDDEEIYVLTARYGLNIEDRALAADAIERVESLRPEHPKLKKLKARLALLRE